MSQVGDGLAGLFERGGDFIDGQFRRRHFHFLTLLPYVETLVKGFYGGPAYKQVFTRSFIDLSEAEIFAHNAFPATVTSSQRGILVKLVI